MKKTNKMIPYSDITIIIPTLNEAKNIGRLINIIKKLYSEVSIIVSDDGSKDGTKEIVKDYNKIDKNIIFLDRSNKEVHGLTASVIDGIKNTKTNYLIVIDADFQHPPEKIKEVIYKLKENDIVIGTRVKILNEWNPYRRLVSKIATMLGRVRLSLIEKIKCRDVLSGFFGIRTKLAKYVSDNHINTFYMEGYKVLFDLLKKVPKNSKIGEVGYVFKARMGGASKLGRKQMIIYLKSIFK